MRGQSGNLSARTVATITKPGRHSDGGGVYLNVSSSGAKSWLFIWKRDGKRHDMGLGALSAVSLAMAREKAAECRAMLANGRDPLKAKEADKAIPTIPTFGKAADELIASMSPGWRNEKHRAQWAMTLGDANCRYLRPKPVNEVRTEDVLAVLKPIWQSKPETASRLRGRIESVLSSAKAHGHRSGENPALWRGHLDQLLPKRQKLSRGHHAAMPYADVPGFIGKLGDREGIAALALEFTILTAARSGEVLGALWREFDLEKNVWTVPAARMKAGREHRIPLSGRTAEIIEKLAAAKMGDFVFPGQRSGKPLSVMAMDMLLRRIGVEVTVHGFRSAFRDWAGNETSFPREVAEAALAHAVGDKAEQAYRRSDALDKRRPLMAAWASYCEPKSETGNVIRMAR